MKAFDTQICTFYTYKFSRTLRFFTPFFRSLQCRSNFTELLHLISTPIRLKFYLMASSHEHNCAITKSSRKRDIKIVISRSVLPNSFSQSTFFSLIPTRKIVCFSESVQLQRGENLDDEVENRKLDYVKIEIKWKFGRKSHVKNSNGFSDRGKLTDKIIKIPRRL